MFKSYDSTLNFFIYHTSYMYYNQLIHTEIGFVMTEREKTVHQIVRYLSQQILIIPVIAQIS